MNYWAWAYSKSNSALCLLRASLFFCLITRYCMICSSRKCWLSVSSSDLTFRFFISALWNWDMSSRNRAAFLILSSFAWNSLIFSSFSLSYSAWSFASTFRELISACILETCNCRFNIRWLLSLIYLLCRQAYTLSLALWKLAQRNSPWMQ